MTNQIAAPEKNIIVVSVTMKGGILSRVTQAPLKAPITPPTAREGERCRPASARPAPAKRAAVLVITRGADNARHGDDRGAPKDRCLR